MVVNYLFMFFGFHSSAKSCLFQDKTTVKCADQWEAFPLTSWTEWMWMLIIHLWSLCSGWEVNFSFWPHGNLKRGGGSSWSSSPSSISSSSSSPFSSSSQPVSWDRAAEERKVKASTFSLCSQCGRSGKTIRGWWSGDVRTIEQNLLLFSRSCFSERLWEMLEWFLFCFSKVEHAVILFI